MEGEGPTAGQGRNVATIAGHCLRLASLFACLGPEISMMRAGTLDTDSTNYKHLGVTRSRSNDRNNTNLVDTNYSWIMNEYIEFKIYNISISGEIYIPCSSFKRQ